MLDSRYTYVGGTSVGGLVVYEDKFAYSHHATDPASGKLCNAFDLVRWHLFAPGGKAKDGTLIDSDQKSIQLMREYAAQDEATKRQLAQERREQAEAEFADEPSDAVSASSSSEDWQSELVVTRQGHVKDTLGNLALILRNDPRLKDISYNIHRSGIDIRHDADGNTTLP